MPPSRHKVQKSKKTSPQDKLEAVKAIYGGARYKIVAKRYRVRRETVDEWCRTLDSRAEVVFSHGATLNAAETLRRRLVASQTKIEALQEKVDELVRKLRELTDHQGDEDDEDLDDDADLPPP
jgi:transposase-like protein